MQKEKRQEIILDLINSNQISKQEELTEMLEELGISINQSSVSRDLVEMGVAKINGFYAIPPKSNYAGFGMLSLEVAGDNLIVAKTEAGFAGAVCVKIDEARFSEIVGTIAGEDTIFIAVRGKEEQELVLNKIWKMFER